MNKEIKYISPFKRFCITIGGLPTSYLESMSYYESLTFLVNYLANNVIPAVNNNGDVVNELQEKFKELTDYVNNYFSDLNVQEQINNKLDDMAEDGELADIILEYLNMNGLIMFNTISDLKGAENLIEGSFTRVLGSSTYDDGEGAYYKIRLLDVSDVIDDYELVSLTNYPTLVAERIHEIFESEISSIETNIGDLDNLTTTDKTSLVNAINENQGNISTLNTDIGDKTNLNTTDKTNLVNAINENNTSIGTLSSLTTNSKSNLVGAINEVNSLPKFNLSETYQAYRRTTDSDTAQITVGKFFTTDNTFTATTSGLNDIYCNILGATNSEGSIGKIYGVIFITCNYNINSTNGFPCLRLRCSDFGITVPDEGYYIWSAANCHCDGDVSCGSIYVGSDGYLYLHGNLNVNPSSKRYALIYNPCLYFWTNFGDIPED